MNVKVCLIGVLSLLAVLTVKGQSSDPYAANTWSFDAFGFWGSRDKGGEADNAWGPGLGANYFFTENWGAGLDTYTDSFAVPYLLNVSGIFRYPLQDRRFAPYGFAGFGKQWDHTSQWTGHLGGGLEYSLQGRTSLFADLRGVFPERTSNYAVLRMGIRFSLR